MAQLQKLRIVDPVLSNVAIGYTNAEFVGGFLFPNLPSMKRGGKIPKFGKEGFKIYDSQRGVRGKAKRIDWNALDPITLALEDHALETPVDDMETEEATDPIQPEIDATNIVQEANRLEREKAQADLAQTLATYPTGNKLTLSGTDQWSDFANSAPIDDVRVAKEAIRAKIGRYPNTLLLGPLVYAKLQDHPKITARFQYSQVAIITAQMLANLFDIERVVIGKGVYADQLGNFADLWGKHAILAWVPSAAGKYIPSFGYTPQLGGRPRILKYREEPNLTIVYVDDSYQVLVTAAEAGYLIQNAIA